MNCCVVDVEITIFALSNYFHEMTTHVVTRPLDHFCGEETHRHARDIVVTIIKAISFLDTVTISLTIP